MEDMESEIGNVNSQIPFIIIQAFLFLIGIFIQYKIIYVCWKEQDGKTWHIHMAHSIVVTIYFAFVIPFWRVTQSFPNLSQYTGEWFCYLASFIRIYCFHKLTFNSLLVAVMKYLFIVHSIKTLRFGEAKIKKAFLVLDLALPFVFATISCVMNDIEGYSELVSCFGLSDQVMIQYNTWEKNMQKFFLCNLNMKEEDILAEYTLYVTKQCVCVLKSAVAIFINTNVSEAFIYYKIFIKMRR